MLVINLDLEPNNATRRLACFLVRLRDGFLGRWALVITPLLGDPQCQRAVPPLARVRPLELIGERRESEALLLQTSHEARRSGAGISTVCALISGISISISSRLGPTFLCSH